MTKHVFVVWASLLASACVTTGTYDKKVAELQKVTADHDRAAAEQEKTLQARIDELQSLIADWLTLARVESGLLCKERVKVDLGHIISEILKTYEPTAAAALDLIGSERR